METDVQESMTGEYRLKFLDLMHSVFSLPANTIWTLGIGTAIFSAAAIYLEGMSIDSIIMITTFAALITPIILVLTASKSAIFYFRMSGDQKNLRWVIDQTRFTLTDGAGNSIHFPWSQIKFVAMRRMGLLIALRPMGHRWIAKRAFSGEAWVQIKEWAKENAVSVR